MKKTFIIGLAALLTSCAIIQIATLSSHVDAATPSGVPFNPTFGTAKATAFTQNGNAVLDTTSTLTSAKLSGALPAISGASLTSLNASNLSSGTVSNSLLSSDVVPLYARKPADTTRTSTSVLADDPDLAVALPSAGTYIFEIRLYMISSDSVGLSSFKYVPAFTGTTSIVRYIEFTSCNNSTTVPGGAQNSYTVDTQCTKNADSTSLFTDYVLNSGMLTTSNGGTFKIQWAQLIASHGTTLLAGSYIFIHKIA